jgi:hypothetical protein
MSAVACRAHRFSDPISEMNGDIRDAARGLVTAVAMLDQMGIAVVSIEADRRRNQRVMVEYSRDCDALNGVPFILGPVWTTWTASRYGIEIRWMLPTESEAP